MSDIKLFRINSNSAEELKGSSVDLEKSLQNLIEGHLETFLGVRFLSSEQTTGKVHGGRIDTLGIDENGCPVIIEYKRSSNMNVINQGLFYLDWLLDHKGDFKDIVTNTLGQGAAQNIDWSAPRLICIASDFTKYDSHAIQQIDRNIDLIRYRKYGNDLILFDLVNGVSGQAIADGDSGPLKSKTSAQTKTVEQQLSSAPPNIVTLFESLRDYCLSLGDDVQLKTLKLYFAFRRLKNFTCVEVTQRHLTLYLAVNPDTVELTDGFTRDVRTIGHWGTGNLEITISSAKDFENAKPLILKSYENN